MVEMDPKVTDATIHWRTNHTDVELSGQKITGEHDSGVKVRCLYNKLRNGLFLSNLKNLLQAPKFL